jgi:hypothetical protein
MAWGWSPVASKSATSWKSGIREVYHRRTDFERAFEPSTGRLRARHDLQLVRPGT